MTTELRGFINVASNSNVTFSNSLKSDLLFFTSSNSQRILMGTKQNSNPSLVISNNAMIVNENLGVGNSNPTCSLDVNGDVNFTGTLRQRGTGFQTSSIVELPRVFTATAVATPADNWWLGVCWSPQRGLFVAVAATGTGNRVMTSPDGVTWTARTSAADNNWYGVCWSPEKGLFVAVAFSGTGNRIMTSPDGINWTARTSPADNQWTSVCWSPEKSLFVAVANSGTGNRVMTSSDGETWAIKTSAADNEWYSVCWSPQLGIFVAVAVSGTNRVMTSTDGNTWTARTSATDSSWRGVCWSPERNLFVAVSASGTVMTSSDGITWTARTSAANNLWLSVCWAPQCGLFVAVAYSGTGNRIMTSPDGIIWTIRTSPADNGWYSVCWAPELNRFAAVSDSGTGNRAMLMRFEPESPLAPLTFKSAVTNLSFMATARATPADNSWQSVCWSPQRGLFVAVAQTGTGNRIMTSPDGITWTARTAAADNNWQGVCWSPERGLFVAVAWSGAGNRVMTSPDGLVWSIRTSVPDNEWSFVCWSPDLRLFVAVAQNGTGTGNRVMTSPDGITWTARTTPADNVWKSVCWSPERRLFVAVSQNGTGNRVMTSPDGETWTIRTSPDNNWHSVCWSPERGLFVAVAWSGTGNRVMTSPNGINWTLRASAADHNWVSVCWAPECGLFVAVANSGTGNRIMTSPDGLVWSTRTSAADNNWRGVCYSPELNRFVAVGETGTGNRAMTMQAGQAGFVDMLAVGGTSAPTARLDVTPVAGQRALRVGTSLGADAMVVDANGNVGIGTTTSALQTLHVVGNAINTFGSILHAYYSFDQVPHRNDAPLGHLFPLETRGTGYSLIGGRVNNCIRYDNPSSGTATTYSIISTQHAANAQGLPWSSAGAVSCWFRLTTNASATFAPTIFYYGFSAGNQAHSALHAFVANSNILTVRGHWGSLTAPTAILLNQWYHLVVTFSGGVCQVYLNGAAVATLASGFPSSLSYPNVFAIGSGTHGVSPSTAFTSASGWIGEIDEFMIYSRGLTQSEVSRLNTLTFDAIQCDGTATVSGNVNVGGNLSVNRIFSGTLQEPSTYNNERIHLHEPSIDGYKRNDLALFTGWGGYYDMCGISWNAWSEGNNNYRRYDNTQLGWALMSQSQNAGLAFRCFGDGYTNSNVPQGVDKTPLSMSPNLVHVVSLSTSTNITTQSGTAAAPSLTFSGDTDTGIFRPADNTIGFATAGVERVRVGADELRVNGGLLMTGIKGGNWADGGIEFRRVLSGGNVDAGSWFIARGSTTDTMNHICFHTPTNAGSGMNFMTTGAVSRMFINTVNGNVGLGTTTPEVQLHLSTGRARKDTGSTWENPSDSRVKVNIEEADYSMCYSNLKSIPLRRFQWDSNVFPDVTDRHEVGWIAQEVETVFPKAVTKTAEKGFEDFMTLNVDQLYKTMWGGLKKCIEIIESQDARIAALEGVSQ
jgi:hypothetical protein